MSCGVQAVPGLGDERALERLIERPARVDEPQQHAGPPSPPDGKSPSTRKSVRAVRWSRAGSAAIFVADVDDPPPHAATTMATVASTAASVRWDAIWRQPRTHRPIRPD